MIEYPTSRPTAGRDGKVQRICYIIQHHTKLDDLLWRMPYLADEGNSFLLSLDINPVALDTARAEFGRIGDCAVVKSPPITWGGFSQVDGFLDNLTLALEKFSNWDYVVNLSGACMPLKTQPEIKEILSRESRAGQRLNHIFAFRIKPAEWFLPDMAQSQPKTYREIDNKISGATFFVADNIVQSFQERTSSPINNNWGRYQYYVSEILGGKQLYIRNTTDTEKKVRLDFVRRVGAYSGRAWFTFTREYAEWLCQARSELLGGEYAFFQNLMCCDELFLQTLAHDPKNPFHNRFVYNSGHRLLGGRPKVLADADLVRLQEETSLFMRKFYRDCCPESYRRLQEKFGITEVST